MSDSEHSTVTYTSLSEDDLYMGSPGVEVHIYEGPPSPDYIPGPEGPPSPDYVPGLRSQSRLHACSNLTTYHLFRSLSTRVLPLGCPYRTQAADTISLSEEVAESRISLTTPPPSPLSPYSSPLPQIPSPPLPNTTTTTHPRFPTYAEGSWDPELLGWTARAVLPTTARADLYGFADTLEAAPGRRMSRELGYGPSMDRTGRLMEEEARKSRCCLGTSRWDACDQPHIRELLIADYRRQGISRDPEDYGKSSSSMIRDTETAGTLLRILQSQGLP
ncbi:hypothetical protein Tco_1473840 [Tanacetum coccineum]